MSTLPPGPRASLWREIVKVRRNPQEFVPNLVRQYGDLVHVAIGSFHGYIVQDPERIRDILVVHPDHFRKGRETQRLIPFLGQGLLTLDGEAHRTRRHLLQPAFHRKAIVSLADLIVQTTLEVQQGWSAGQVDTLSRRFSELTMTLILRTMFSTSITPETARAVRGDLTIALRLYIAYLGLPMEFLLRVPLPTTRHFWRATQQLEAYLSHIVAKRRTHPTQSYQDVLALLLAAEEQNDPTSRLTDQEIIAEVKTLFFAGHETLASALTWTWYLLARHPEVRERVLAELAMVVGERLPTGEDLEHLPYTMQVFSEALRLYPPVIALSRTAQEPYTIGEYHLPTGSHLYMSQYAIQRDPRWWPDPDRFDPERFTPDAKAQRPRFTYFPFGGGSRLCIGEPLAWMEGMLIMATLLPRWKWTLLNPHFPGYLSNIITLHPKGGIPAQFDHR